MPAHDQAALSLDERLPSQIERDSAAQMSAILRAHARDDGAPVELRVHDRPEPVTLLPAVANLLTELLDHIASGHTVKLVPRGKLVTTQQAADMLNVSRPFLIKRLLGTELPFVEVGRHRRLRAEDVIAYRERRDAARTAALKEMADLDLQDF